MQLTEIELTTSRFEDEYTGKLVGKPTHNVELAKELKLDASVLFAKGIQIQCVEYSRGTFVQVSATCSFEILHGILQNNSLSVVVQPLQPFVSEPPIVKWQRLPKQIQLLAASKLRRTEPLRLLRADQNGLWLLR